MQEESEVTVNELKTGAFKSLLRVGIDKSDIKSNSIEVENVEEAILQISEKDDLIVMSESQNDEREKWFSSIHEKVQKNINSSLLLIFQEEIRRPDQTEQEAAEEVVSKDEG